MHVKTYTSFYLGGLPKDFPYATYVARVSGLKHELLPINNDYALKLSEEVIKLLHTFDPIEVRNDVAALAVLKKAADDGCEYVLTGDGGDELFAGYPYMLVLTSKELNNYIKYLTGAARYPTVELGKKLGIKVIAPFTTKEAIEVSLRTPPEL